MSPDGKNTRVNNSALVNALAETAIRAPMDSHLRLGIKNDRWKHFADSIYIPFDNKHNYHPEFDGYRRGKFYCNANWYLMTYAFKC